MTQQDDRPAPEALLAEAKKEGRGKLKVFLGAYPGVGKTFAMLQAAQERRREGIDVVVGIVETHGRAETEALLHDLDILPRKHMPYRGLAFGEMDLEAILSRQPRLVLVDELAHTNIEGGRHEKRWQDVEEILAAGIDVYTTLNVQHIESLNDVIARISGVRVRETLPDKALELADEFELIDLPPDDLLQRLRDGKVYVTEQVGRAMRHFFSKANLTALRELAMRVAAERVDAQMVDYMRAHAVPGPWPAQDRLLVCVNESPVAKNLVRAARRIAERQRIPWIAVNVQTTRHAGLDDVAKDRIAEALRLAESLGGEVVTLHAESDVVAELLSFARQFNATRLLVGRPRRRRWTGLFREAVTQRLIDNAAPFEITIVSPLEPEPTRERIGGGDVRVSFDWRAYLLATGMVAVATAAAYIVWHLLPLPNISLVFVVAVLLAATLCGLGPSIYASFLSFLLYNFLFTEPIYTFTVFRQEELFTIIFFLFVAIVVGNLAARLTRQVETMRSAARRTANLFDFSRRIAAAASLDDVLWAAVHHVASTLPCRSLVLLPDEKGPLHIAAGYPPEDQLSLKDRGAAEWAWENGRPAGWKSDTLPSADWLFLPLTTRRGAVGLLGVSFEDRQRPMMAEQHRLLDALVDQVAVAVERTNLATAIEDARVLTETEQLRAALLSSVSHDLRTPLVSIIGSATSLASYSDALTNEDRQQLILTILEEGERLNRFVQNLLDMTRLGYGALQPNKEWCDPREIAGRALKRLGKSIGSRRIVFDVPENLPALHVDPVLIEQVLVNILDNAVKYTDAVGEIGIAASRRGDLLVIHVTDDGQGIPEEEREAVFDVFYRVRARDRQRAGTGLGLSICRGIIEAHGGRIAAKAPAGGRGTLIEITLPVANPPALIAGDDERLAEPNAAVGRRDG